MFFNTFLALCEKKNISPTRVALDIGLSKAAVTRWKQTESTPNSDVLVKLADYFGCSTDYLLGRSFSPSELSQEALELASRWDKLDNDGKALVRAELVHAEREKKHD